MISVCTSSKVSGDTVQIFYDIDMLSNLDVNFRVEPLYFIGILAPSTKLPVGQHVTTDEGTPSKGGLSPRDMLAWAPIRMDKMHHEAIAQMNVDDTGRLDVSISYISSLS